MNNQRAYDFYHFNHLPVFFIKDALEIFLTTEATIIVPDVEIFAKNQSGSPANIHLSL